MKILFKKCKDILFIKFDFQLIALLLIVSMLKDSDFDKTEIVSKIIVKIIEVVIK